MCVHDVKNDVIIGINWKFSQELLQKLDSDLDKSVSQRDFHIKRNSTPLSSSTPWRSIDQRRPHRVRCTFNIMQLPTKFIPESVITGMKYFKTCKPLEIIYMNCFIVKHLFEC